MAEQTLMIPAAEFNPAEDIPVTIPKNKTSKSTKGVIFISNKFNANIIAIIL